MELQSGLGSKYKGTRLSETAAGSDFLSIQDTGIVPTNDAWKAHQTPAYHEYRELWDRAAREKIELDFPLNVDIETTTVCNLRCPYCPRTVMVDKGELSPDDSLTRQEFAPLVDQAAAMGTKAIKLNYNGEPLAHKDVVWQIDYAKKAGIVDVSMNTNGVLLKPPKSVGILEAGIDGVFVSFDGVNPELFAKSRVGTTLGRVADNLYEFVKLRNKIRPACTLRVNMVYYGTPESWEQFVGLKAMWGGLVDAVSYGTYGDFEHDEGLKEFPEVKGWHCAQPFQRLVLKANGNATICCPDTQDAMCVGNWREVRLYDLWHSPLAREIRRKHACGDYYQLDRCRKCRNPHADVSKR